MLVMQNRSHRSRTYKFADVRWDLLQARKQAQAYYRLYHEHIPVAQLVREVAAVMQEYTRECAGCLSLSSDCGGWTATLTLAKSLHGAGHRHVKRRLDLLTVDVQYLQSLAV